MIRRVAIILAALSVLVVTVAFGGAQAGAQTTTISAPCNSIAQDGGTPLSSVDETSCLQKWIGTLNLTTNTSATPIVWDLGGQSYEVDSGLLIAGAQYFTIQNGAFYDAETPQTVATGSPAIELTGAGAYSKNPEVATNDTLQNLTVEGAYSGGGLQNGMADAAGIETEGVENLLISNVKTSWTYGDGIHLGPFLVGSSSGDKANTTGNVDNVVTNHTGRCGIAPIGVNALTIDGASMTGTGLCAIDMEVDSPNTPVKQVTLDNISTDSYIELDGVAGPIAINNWDVTEGSDPDLLDESDNQATPLTITGGTVQCGETAGPYPCFDIHQTDAGAVVSDMVVTMGDNAYQNHTPLWSVGANSPTAFTNDCITSPGGTYKAGDNASGGVTVTNPAACPSGTISFPPPKAGKRHHQTSGRARGFGSRRTGRAGSTTGRGH